MQEVNPAAKQSHLQYFGADITKTVADINSRCFQSSNVHFYQFDWTCQVPPPVDLVLVRDILFHLPTQTNLHVLHQINRSGAKYLLTTTYARHTTPAPGFVEQVTGSSSTHYRDINLFAPPYNFPDPLEIVEETERTGKVRSVAMWKLPITTMDAVVS